MEGLAASVGHEGADGSHPHCCPILISALFPLTSHPHWCLSIFPPHSRRLPVSIATLLPLPLHPYFHPIAVATPSPLSPSACPFPLSLCCHHFLLFTSNSLLSHAHPIFLATQHPLLSCVHSCPHCHPIHISTPSPWPPVATPSLFPPLSYGHLIPMIIATLSLLSPCPQ